MKKFALLFFAITFLQHYCFAQSVGIGTTSPNASAALEITSTNKGLLIPRVSLQSASDVTTIPSPATSLLVYNINILLATGSGYYFNNGTPASPKWTRMNQLTLPYYDASPATGPTFQIDNYSSNTSSVAIKGFAGGQGIGVQGFAGNGIGVSASATTGTALDVDGKIQITGNSQVPAQGKVLTSDANGNATWEGAVAFSATGIKPGQSSSISPNTDVKVPFWNENYDLGNNYNNSETSPHSTFTAPVHGIYHFDVKVIWTTNISGYGCSLSLYKLYNGNVSVIDGVINNFLGYAHVDQILSTDVELQAGAQVYVNVNHNVSGTNINLQPDAQYAHFNGMLKIKL